VNKLGPPNEGAETASRGNWVNAGARRAEIDAFVCHDPEGDWIADQRKQLQLPACDKCTQGVMDATNNHYLGLCACECHDNAR